MSNHPYNHGYPWYTSRSDIPNTDIHVDIHADIGATGLEAQFTADIRGCTDNSTRTSVMLRISKRKSARTVRPGVPLLNDGYQNKPFEGVWTPNGAF